MKWGLQKKRYTQSKNTGNGAKTSQESSDYGQLLFRRMTIAAHTAKSGYGAMQG